MEVANLNDPGSPHAYNNFKKNKNSLLLQINKTKTIREKKNQSSNSSSSSKRAVKATKVHRLIWNLTLMTMPKMKENIMVPISQAP